jgi:hypothetical protein
MLAVVICLLAIREGKMPRHYPNVSDVRLHLRDVVAVQNAVQNASLRADNETMEIAVSDARTRGYGRASLAMARFQSGGCERPRIAPSGGYRAAVSAVDRRAWRQWHVRRSTLDNFACASMSLRTSLRGKDGRCHPFAAP